MAAWRRWMPTSAPPSPPANGRADYGGAHVIEDLIAGRPVKLKATSHGTDCYPRKDIETYISLKTVNQAYLFNPRNAYQNYAAAINSGEKTLFTYMGKLLPNLQELHLFQRGAAVASAEGPQPAHHRHRHAHLPGRGPGLRLLGRDAV